MLCLQVEGRPMLLLSPWRPLSDTMIKIKFMQGSRDTAEQQRQQRM